MKNYSLLFALLVDRFAILTLRACFPMLLKSNQFSFQLELDLYVLNMSVNIWLDLNCFAYPNTSPRRLIWYELKNQLDWIIKESAVQLLLCVVAYPYSICQAKFGINQRSFTPPIFLPTETGQI